MNRVSLIPQTYNHEKLITGDIDAIATYLSNELFKLKSKGVAVNVIDPRSYGIDFYGDNLFTTEKEVDQQPDRVKKMVRATLKGWEYALEHKDEIIDLILKKYNPALGRNQLGYEAKVVDQMIVPDLVPIGEINPRRYERIAETYRRLGISQSSTVPEGFIYRAKPEPAVLLTAEERAWLAAHPDILIGYTDVFEPEVITNPDGSHRGILVDFLDELNRRLGTRIRLRIDPIPELLGKAQKRETDGILNILPEYADKLGLLKTDGYLTGYGAVFTRKNIVFDRPSDLAGKKVAIVDGVMFAKLIVERYGAGATILKVNDALEGLQRVDRGEVDLFLGASINANFLSKYQLFGLVLQYVCYSHPYTGGMAIRPDWPELVTILNKGIASFSKNEINAIVAKWANVPGQKKTLKLTAEEQAWLDQNHKVRVRAADWPPYLIIKENDPPQGIAIEYLKLIEERTGLTFEYEEAKQPFAEFLESIKQRQGPDMTPLIAQTPGREQYLSFTTPYISSPYVIFAREQEEILLDIGGLSGKTLAVPKGFIIQQLLERDYPEIRLVLFENDEQSLVALSSGKVDAYIGNLTVASHLIQKRGLSNLRVVAPTPYGDQVLSMGNRNDWPELTTIIDKALVSITESEKTAIRNKYVALRYEQGINCAEALKWALIVSGSTLGIVLLFVFWNRSLTQMVHQRTDELESSNESLVTEVAERTKAEKALRESRNYLENLTNSLPDAVLLVKMPERVIEWANGTDNVLGYEPDECVGKTTEFLYPDKKDFIEFGDKIQRAILEGDDIFHIEQTLKNESGDLFPVDIDVSLFRIDQSVVSVTAIVRNITKRKRAEQEIQLYQERLKALAAQLTIAEEKERRRIAADLHDHVGHSLALARMQLNGILESDSHLERKILVKDISNIMLLALQETRSLIFELSTQSMNDIGLAAAISEWLEEKIEKRHGLKAECSGTFAKNHQKTLGVNVQTLLFRSVRELLTNVVKHARANKVAVHLGEQDNNISITIEDDGIGFDHDSLKSKNGQKRGFGLFSIQERMTNMGGAFAIQSEPGKGCRVVLRVPVAEGRRD